MSHVLTTVALAILADDNLVRFKFCATGALARRFTGTQEQSAAMSTLYACFLTRLTFRQVSSIVRFEMAAVASLSKEEYLKRYLSGGDSGDKKKKLKKSKDITKKSANTR